MEKVAMNYFMELITSTSPDVLEEFLETVPTLILDQINNRLMVLATEEEVRKVLCMMHSEKALGSDGMTVLFYQRTWPIIKGEVLDFVNDFLMTSSFDQRIIWTKYI